MFNSIFQYLTPFNWLIAGAVLVLIDVLLGSFFFLWIGVSAGLVGVLFWLIPGLSGEIQLLVFATLTSLSLLIWYKYKSSHAMRNVKQSPLLNLRTQHYVGKHFTVFEPIVNNRGKIKIGDSTWLVTGEDCPIGTTVVVTGVDGTVLKVKKIDVD